MRGWRFSSARPSGRPSNDGSSSSRKAAWVGLDGDRAQLDAERVGQPRRVGVGVVGREAARHRHGVHVLGAEGVGGDGGDERRVDPTREPEHDIGEAVLRDVVAGGEHERVVDLGDAVEQRDDLGPMVRLGVGGHGAGHGTSTASAAAVSRPRGSSSRVRNTGRTSRSTMRTVLAELGHPGDQLALVVDDERRAVEDQLVLPADLVDVDDVAVGVLGPGGDHPLPLALPAREVGRAVGDHDELGAARGLLGDRSLRAPHVLADRDADLHASDLVQLQGLVAGGEVALLVEHGVVRQEALAVGADHRVRPAQTAAAL